MSDSTPISGTTSGSEDNPQNHDIVEGDVAADKPSQAEGDTGDTNDSNK
ncbi:MAG TPA: hypothetical protein VGP24_11675 [Glaciihabitans sp.]|jgi:hypothetical protein|nr:hypothetical protein [Glaciihabitans sp.]